MIYSIVGSGNLTPIPTTTSYPAPSGRTGAIVLDDILKMIIVTRGRRLSLEDKLGASQSFMKFAGSSSLNRSGISRQGEEELVLITAPWILAVGPVGEIGIKKHGSMDDEKQASKAFTRRLF